MLNELNIGGIALIDELRITFHRGLNILTGETGAGKSIIINSLLLILGKRVATDILRTGYTTGYVEAVFNISQKPNIFNLLHESGIDVEGSLIIIKRQIFNNGRSRAWINQCAVTLSTLQKIAGKLVDISSQREHNYLLNVDNHIKVLDSSCQIQDAAGDYIEKYAAWKAKKDDLAKQLTMQQAKAARVDFLLFQQKEIDQANLALNEDIALKQTQLKLQNKEKLSSLCYQAEETLYNQPQSATSLISDIQNRLFDLKEVDPKMKAMHQTIETVNIQLDEFISEIRTYVSSIENDPNLLIETEDRLNLISDLKKKYGGTIESILATRQEIDNELGQLEKQETTIELLQTELRQQEDALYLLTKALTEKRQKGAKKLGKLIIEELGCLGMDNTLFKAVISPLKGCQGIPLKDLFISRLGADHIEFLISPNKGEELRSLSQIVSGGELSRIMLAIKSIFSRFDDVHVFIFDEIDTGIGGQIAVSVGQKLAKLARERQVLCITHLPRIASFSNTHYVVEKTLKGNRTTTSVRKLTGTINKTQEIARMISGKQLSDESLALASEMIRSAEVTP